MGCHFLLHFGDCNNTIKNTLINSLRSIYNYFKLSTYIGRVYICLALVDMTKQSFTGRTDAEAETPILWPPYVKSRDITLPTKVHLVKATDFPVVMYGCES